MQTVNPAPAPASPARRRPLHRRILRWGLFTGAILFVLFAIAWVSYSAWTHRALARERRLIGEAGEPLNWGAFHDRYSDSTLQSWWDVPTDEKEEAARSQSASEYAEFMEPLPPGAEHFYAAAMELMVYVSGRQTLADRIMATMDRDQREMTEQEAAMLGHWLEEQRLLFELVDKGASIPHCRYQMLTDDGRLEGRVFSKLRPLADTLAARARWQAHHGEVDAAVDSIIGMLRLNRMMALRPCIIARVVQAGIEQHAFAEIQRLISQHTLSVEALRRLADELKALDDGERFRRMLIAERIRVMDELESGRLDWWVREWILDRDQEWLIIPPPVRRHFQAVVLADVRLALEAAEQPYREQMALHRTLEVWGTAMRGAGIESSTLSLTRTMRGAIAVELYRFAHAGRMPQSWDQLVTAKLLAAPPVDPLSGEAMKLRITGTSYTIYSVGQNGLDDGGVITPPGRGPPLDTGLLIQVVPRN